MLAYLRTGLFTRVSTALSFSWFSTASPSSLQNQYQVMSAKDIVEKAIASNDIAIFSKSWCGFCRRAKALLKEKYPNVNTIILELDERDDGVAIQDYLHTKTGQSTVPNIFVAKEYIGGCDNTFAAEKSGRLADLLN